MLPDICSHRMTFTRRIFVLAVWFAVGTSQFTEAKSRFKTKNVVVFVKGNTILSLARALSIYRGSSAPIRTPTFRNMAG